MKKETLAFLRKKFCKGARVRLKTMDDPYTKIPPGTLGTVRGVDDEGTIHVSWDCGSGLGIVYGVDECELVE